MPSPRLRERCSRLAHGKPLLLRLPPRAGPLLAPATGSKRKHQRQCQCRPPHLFPPTTISKVNTGVCDVEIDGTGGMCGTVFRDQPSLRRHLRDAHPRAAHNPTRVNVTAAEKLEGEKALDRWLLTGGWRGVRHGREPERGSKGWPVARYADACERIAREDAEFRGQVW